ncbi:hypothetical protein BP6252_04084 [Coleophoma cylindrospora]|uniref:Peptidase M3A/M3B catalytic domain-containing protein n=1 Tax=Coleophoma cylindrospora TaxID=1849047 RepID=A0A3D8RZI2_9HELO|nr:hypothetical protein BP6252_04084 [Coleophoma cylindrospora]
MKQNYSYDRAKVAEYFSLEATINGMLKNFENLFGLDFEEVTGRANVWHEDVQVYSVWDAEEQGGGFLGYLYLDLYAREGKGESAFNFNLQPGFLKQEGTRQFCSTVLSCSLPKPSSKSPCLLYHWNVVILFHELGHGIHNLVSKTLYARFHGTAVAVDFGEAPSQMLEQWCYIPTFLKSLGQHYSYDSPESFNSWEAKANGAPRPPIQLPDEMIQNIVRLRPTSSASSEAIKDMDLAQEYHKLIREIKMFDIPDQSSEWSRSFSTFPHFVHEYDAGYYSYLFSQAYSTEIFYTAFRSDPMSRKQGLRFRQCVLERGGSQDEMKSLTDFLGRAPTIEPFYESLGLNRDGSEYKDLTLT